jgi:hypothetical protein
VGDSAIRRLASGRLPRPAGTKETPVMDETMNRLARELADAIAAAVNNDAQVQGCRQRARAEGFDLQVSIDANIGFATRAGVRTKPARPKAPPKPVEMTANDRRFLRSLRIAPDETKSEVE